MALEYLEMNVQLNKLHVGKKQDGQSMFEMIVVFPFVLILIFGIIQWGFVARAKITLNTATEQAARAGALNFGQMNAINRAFAQGMTPLFMRGNDSRGALLQAYMRARMSATVNARVTIMNPSNRVFQRFAQNEIYPLERRNFREIPNDNLMFRSSNRQGVGGGQVMNIQDANLLQIKIDWCEELIIPVVGDLIAESANGLFTGAFFLPSQEQVRCAAIGRATNRPLIAMQSIATYRMQTPYRGR